MEEDEEKRKEHPWAWKILLLIGILLILFDFYRMWGCLQDPCCSLHWLLINKEAIGCPMMPSGGFSWPV